MNGQQRQEVLDNARYLRQVRPLDPEEIADYVEGQPHPAAVRQVLREHAVELSLLEREDDTFVPVEEGERGQDNRGLQGTGEGDRLVGALPERYGRQVADLLVDELGAGWPDGDSGDRLRERVRAFKSSYLHDEPVEYDRLTALGYAIYHLPAYYATVQYVLAELAADDLLSAELRVLDVGAGVGGPALGLHDFLPAGTLVDYHAVEPSAAADVLRQLLGGTGRNFHTTVHRDRAETFDPGCAGAVDLLLFANVLSELDDAAGTLTRYLDALAEGGTAVALAPADRETAIHLREVERAVEATGASVYAPALRLWPGEQPAGECWSFDRRPDLDRPALQRRLDEGDRGTAADTPSGRSPGDGEFVNVDVQYAYSLLRVDGRERVSFTPDPDRVARMADTETHVTDRVDCVGVKLSRDLGSGNPLFLVGDGSERVDHFAVLTESTTLNRTLETADYGAVLWFENVLVLWNDDEGAYNLVADSQTVIDPVTR
jgi:SAM-dependent methyltransferase